MSPCPFSKAINITHLIPNIKIFSKTNFSKRIQVTEKGGAHSVTVFVMANRFFNASSNPV